ncbi:MAG: rod-binding protein [Mobilitalea sp.]
MSISIGADSAFSTIQNATSSSTKTKALESSLNNSSTATDEELMDVCKTFESYLLEQVFKGLEKTVPKTEDEENEYITQFGDMLYEEYAEDATESQGLGIAQMLYDSMKRNS